MNVPIIVFYVFALIAAAASISLVFVRNVFYGALLLIVCLLSVAALYVVAFAEFVAVTQILVYAGGVLVVTLFGIMLTARLAGKPLVVDHAHVFGGTLVAGSFVVMLTYFIGQHSFEAPPPAVAPADTIHRTGVSLMSNMVLPFEVAGILLLVALIGAAVMASHMKSDRTS